MCRGKAAFVDAPAEKSKALMILMKTQAGEEHEISEKMAEAVTVIRIEETEGLIQCEGFQAVTLRNFLEVIEDASEKTIYKRRRFW